MKIQQFGAVTKHTFIHLSTVYLNMDNWSIIKPKECLFETEYFVYRICKDTDCKHLLIATREYSHVSIIITVDRN